MECNDFIPRISLYIDASLYQPGILRLLRQLRPEWKQESIKFRTFEGGQTNSIIAVSCHEETMVIRIYGDNTEKIINRELERDSLIKLNKYTAAPPVYAYFTNGLCCGYAEGRQVELHELHDPKMGYRIAKELARVHTIPVSDEDSKHPLLYSVFLSSWLDQLPGKLNSEAKTYRCVRACVRVCYMDMLEYMCMIMQVCLYLHHYVCNIVQGSTYIVFDHWSTSLYL